MAQRLPAFVDRPVRDGELFKNANPALRAGLLSSGPFGTDFSLTTTNAIKIPLLADPFGAVRPLRYRRVQGERKYPGPALRIDRVPLGELGNGFFFH